MVLPRPPRLKVLTRPELKRRHMPNDGNKGEQMGSVASVHTLCKQAMRLHNVNNLLHSIAVELVNVVVKQLLWYQVGWLPPVWLLRSLLPLVQQPKCANVA